MKILFFVFAIFAVLKANAQNYFINFTGSGASTSVTSVKVENLTKNTSLTLSEGDILRLTVVTGVYSIEDKQSSALKIYPNPMTDNATLEIFPPVEGNAIISVYDMIGKPVAQIQGYLENYRQVFLLSGISNGFYLINVKGNNYQYSGKLVSNGESGGTIHIEKLNNIIQKVVEKIENKDTKGSLATFDMAYSTGDRLKFTAIAGIYSTVLTDVPGADKTINFNFIGCTDVDNNNYPVVTIGTQVWMAENLKTTKYNDGTAITNVTDNTEWTGLTTSAYCDYNNIPSNSATYGRLYNWLVAASTNPKNVCPTGWHVPSDTEWTTLENYLITNGYNYDGTTTGNKYAKSLAGTTFWAPSSIAGAVGNTDFPLYRNKSGFSALPGGDRTTSGAFEGIGLYGLFWSATARDDVSAWSRYLINSLNDMMRSNNSSYYTGFSIRCLKDN